MAALAGSEVDVFVPSFPQIQEKFGLSVFQVQLLLSLNFFTFCITSLIIGTVADRIGRKPSIMVSLVIFIIGSAFCALSQEFWQLLLGRILQGIGIAAPATVVFAIISDLYEMKKQQIVLGILNGLITVSMALAPILGSYLAFHFGWKGSFDFLLVFGVVCFIIAFFGIPNYEHEPEAVHPVDGSYLKLFKSSKFMRYLISISFLYSVYWVYIGISPIIFMKELGVSLHAFGFYQGSITVSFAIACLLSPVILNKVDYMRVLRIGLAMACLGIIYLIYLTFINTSNPLHIVIAMILLLTGAALPLIIIFPLSIAIVPEAKARASALIQAVRLIITAIGLQSLGYMYDGSFRVIGFMLLGYIFVGVVFYVQILQKDRKDLLQNNS